MKEKQKPKKRIYIENASHIINTGWICEVSCRETAKTLRISTVKVGTMAVAEAVPSSDAVAFAPAPHKYNEDPRSNDVVFKAWIALRILQADTWTKWCFLPEVREWATQRMQYGA